MLFLDARNYYTVVDRTLNEWSEWQLKNLNAIVWLYRGEIEKYKVLLQEYYQNITVLLFELDDVFRDIPVYSDPYLYRYSPTGESLFRKRLHLFLCCQIALKSKSMLTVSICPGSKTTEKIFDDVTVFERINQYFIAKKRGYKNVKDYKKSVLAEQGNAREKLDSILSCC